MVIIEETLTIIGALAVLVTVFYGLVMLIGAIACEIEERRHKKQDPLRVLKCEINRMRPDRGAVLNPPSANLRKFVQEAYGVRTADGATTEVIIRAIIVKELKGGEYDH